MTDVSVEEPTEETASPAEIGGRPTRPFSLSLSLSADTEPPASSTSEPVLAVVETITPATDEVPSPSLAGTATVSPLSPPAPVTPVSSAVVKGRIKVADEVVEKVAALATLEVTGVAELGGDAAHAVEPVRERAGIGARRGPRGVSAHVQDRTAAVDVSIVAEYGHVVMDVANEVKTNVARTVSRMLGMRVVEVNVDVEDVRLPGEVRPEAPAEPAKHA
ncbi:Asp23/Gls24 family envelope stress response protein [Streptosporangium amethystogenes]|uniref:Asp23/Gls24 family envelope stress response protein n=1 Tax=Streptosporangium amethystogenes TaxID=2002 RepID=UPI000691B9CD|nr:Asp23/Gls24 family envelope stress response protein [Streptosporangium amethystogenes]